jgi:hypothetical protein
MTRATRDLLAAAAGPSSFPAGEADRLVAPDPFDPASLRLDPGAELVAVRKVIVRVPVRKPGPQEFVRVHPDPGRRLDTALVELKEERETYLLAPALRAELGDEARPTRLYTAISRAGALFLWPVALPGPDGRQNPWHQSAHRAAELAAREWVRLRASHAAGEYEIAAAAAPLPDPEWPDLSFQEMLRLAFREAHIDSADHPVVRRLRGLT